MKEEEKYLQKWRRKLEEIEENTEMDLSKRKEFRVRSEEGEKKPVAGERPVHGA